MDAIINQPSSRCVFCATRHGPDSVMSGTGKLIGKSEAGRDRTANPEPTGSLESKLQHL
jgi:hypothetical protein